MKNLIVYGLLAIVGISLTGCSARAKLFWGAIDVNYNQPEGD